MSEGSDWPEYRCPECDYQGKDHVFDPLMPDQPALCPECDDDVELVEVDDV